MLTPQTRGLGGARHLTTTWTIFQHDGPNHLGLWLNGLKGEHLQRVVQLVELEVLPDELRFQPQIRGDTGHHAGGQSIFAARTAVLRSPAGPAGRRPSRCRAVRPTPSRRRREFLSFRWRSLSPSLLKCLMKEEEGAAMPSRRRREFCHFAGAPPLHRCRDTGWRERGGGASRLAELSPRAAGTSPYTLERGGWPQHVLAYSCSRGYP